MRLNKLFQSLDIVRSNIDIENTEVSDIKYHSTQVEAGDIFVAVKGSSTSGTLYIQEAVDRGCVCVVCETVPEDSGVPFIQVKNAREALALMSKVYFDKPDEKLKLIGITGTNGKTSTTYLIREILVRKYGDVVGLIGTNQNLVGNEPKKATRTTPQSYEIYKLLRDMVDKGCKYGVMEVSSHALEQKRTHGLEFEVGIFTNISQDHMDFHIDMKNYKEAKAKLFHHCKYAVMNGDDPAFRDMTSDNINQLMLYGVNSSSCQLKAQNIKYGLYKVEFEVEENGTVQGITIPMPGLFTVYNALAAMGTGLLLGVGISDIGMALKTAKGVLGRYQRVEAAVPYSIIIDYAHTPEGMDTVLNMTRQVVGGRIITLFGCGGDRDKTKRPLMGAVAQKYSDIVVLTSDNPRSENPRIIINDVMQGLKDNQGQLFVIEDRAAAIEYALSIAKEGDTVMLLGKGHEVVQHIKDEELPFNESEIVKKYLDNNKK